MEDIALTKLLRTRFFGHLVELGPQRWNFEGAMERFSVTTTDPTDQTPGYILIDSGLGTSSGFDWDGDLDEVLEVLTAMAENLVEDLLDDEAFGWTMTSEPGPGRWTFQEGVDPTTSARTPVRKPEDSG